MDPLYVLLVLLYSFFLLFFGPTYLGLLLYRRERYRAALRCFRWLYALTPVVRTWRGPAASFLAATYTSLEEYEPAHVYAEEAVRENTRRRYRRFLLSSQLQLAVLLSIEGEYERSERIFDEILSGPSALVASRRWAEIYAANTYLMRGRMEDAERLLNEALADKKLKPDMQSTAYYVLSGAAYYKNDLPTALEHAQRARQFGTTTARMRVTALSSVLLYLAEMGNVEEGKKVEAELLPQLPIKPARVQQAALRAVARLALATGDLDRARDYAERAERADLNPNGRAAALLIQAEVFAARHNAHRAVRLCETVIESNAIDFHKARAEVLRQSLLEPVTRPVAVTASPTLPITQETTENNILRVQN
jgi:tetratricopeptide (TPR) repeat protein